MSAKSLVKWKSGFLVSRKSWAFGKTRNPSICGKAAVGYARIDAVSVTVISGSNKRIVLGASSWFSGCCLRRRRPERHGHAVIGGGEHGGEHAAVGGHAADRDFLGFLPIASISCCPHLPNVVRLHHLMAFGEGGGLVGQVVHRVVRRYGTAASP